MIRLWIIPVDVLRLLEHAVQAVVVEDDRAALIKSYPVYPQHSVVGQRLLNERVYGE